MVNQGHHYTLLGRTPTLVDRIAAQLPALSLRRALTPSEHPLTPQITRGLRRRLFEAAQSEHLGPRLLR
jgi:hypothetical protein